jgi:hypothetical protein
VKRKGMYPRVQADTSGTGVASQAGGVALVETVRACGVDTALSAVLAPWRKPTARHDPAKVITDLAVTLELGGDCLADVALLCAEPSVFGLVASDPTVSRTIDALAADAPRALKAIDTARARARPLRGPDPQLEGHRPNQPSATRFRTESDLVRHRCPRRRAHRLDADARPHQARGAPVGTQTPTATAVQPRRPPRTPRPCPAVAPVRTLALGGGYWPR